jgi:CO dehydrogenase/acetyl-CoA synthase gamma subunit (corrinoid Fe-S protein)
MTRFKTPLEIYALLPKTNCGECGIATCLAFAAAVLKEEKQPADCPRLDQVTLARLGGAISKQVNIGPDLPRLLYSTIL